MIWFCAAQQLLKRIINLKRNEGKRMKNANEKKRKKGLTSNIEWYVRRLVSGRLSRTWRFVAMVVFLCSSSPHL